MAFAPGKVILLGEHAVVYGHPALAGALGHGVEVVAVPGDLRLRVPAWDVAVLPGEGPTALAAAWRAIVDGVEAALGRRAAAVDLVATFGLPTGAGLGSSAALSVAAARALAGALGAHLDQEQVFSIAMAAENVFHGRASGIDHAVAAHGCFGLFTRAEGFRPVAAPALALLVGHTGRERDTRGRVARVAAIHAERPVEAERCFAEIAALVRRGTEAVVAGDLATLGALMREDQRRLEWLEVSCPEIERMCALAVEAGALGAKLTGGGGGGCVIAVAPGREDAVRGAWERAGFASFLTHVGGSVHIDHQGHRGHPGVPS